MDTLCCIFCCRTRLRVVKKTNAYAQRRPNLNSWTRSRKQTKNHLTVAETEDLVFHNIPRNPNLRSEILQHIEDATKIAEKKTSQDRIERTLVKQDAFINVNTFLGGLLLFGLTGRRSSEIVPDRTVLEFQLLSFFVFLGAIMSSLMFMLFVKFHNWKKYKPYQDALMKIKKKSELVWWSLDRNHHRSKNNDGNHVVEGNTHNGNYFIDDCDYSHHNGLLFNEWNLYQQYQSITNVKTKSERDNLKLKPIMNGNDEHDNDHNDGANTDTDEDARVKEFSQWTKEVLEIAAREESRARETLRRWSIILPFTLTVIGMIFLCLVVFMGADVQLHKGSQRDQSHHHLEVWIYIVAPLSLFLPFCITLGLIRYYTGRLHDFYE